MPQAQVINTNVPSLNAQRNLSGTGGALAVSLQRLSSGLRINSAKDDAAGLAISERFSAQIIGSNQARRNANDGISLAQTAEGALKTSADILQRIRVLAVQSANATNSPSDRQALNDEVNALTAELDRIARTAEFNGRKMLDGSFTSAIFQVGPNANQTITATSANFTTNSYGNYRIGGRVADTAGGPGDLVLGTNEAGAVRAQAGTSGGVSAIPAGKLTVAGGAGSFELEYPAGASAKQIAEKVNMVTQSTGVKATAHTQLDLVEMQQGSSYVLEVASNNITTQPVKIAFTIGGISGEGSVTNTDHLSGAVDAFNKVAAKTGISARVNEKGDGITLVNDNGEDIVFANQSATGNDITMQLTGGATMAGTNILTAANTNEVGKTGAGSIRVTGQVTFDSHMSFGVTDSNAVADNVTAGGFLISDSGTTPVGGQLQTMQNADVTTVDASYRTINLVDAALDTINAQRAAYGALQSRFENTITNLQVSSENMSAARSRIRDTDFAEETAELTRAQILQQAGTAMLSQANALPQQVLQLLQ